MNEPSMVSYAQPHAVNLLGEGFVPTGEIGESWGYYIGGVQNKIDQQCIQISISPIVVLIDPKKSNPVQKQGFDEGVLIFLGGSDLQR